MGKFIKVKEIEVEGSSHKWEVVDKPEACVLGVFNQDYTKMFLIKEFRIGIKDDNGNFGGFTYGSPAGIMDKDGENPAETILRELEEETGFKKDDAYNIKNIGTYYPSCGFSSEQVHLFTCQISDELELKIPDFSESGEMIIERKWVKVEDVPNLVKAFSTNLILEKTLREIENNSNSYLLKMIKNMSVKQLEDLVKDIEDKKEEC